MAARADTGRTSLPVCLFENPYGLVSLWDMLRLFASHFVHLMEELRQGELEVGGILNKRRGYVAAVEYSNELGTTLAMLSDHCEHLRLRSAVKQVSHIKRRLINRDDITEILTRDLEELRRRIREDLEDSVLLKIDPSLAAEFYEPIQNSHSDESSDPLIGSSQKRSPETLWGDDVCSKFKSTISDIKAAADCRIFEQPTACVFHLMRVLESGMRALAKSLKDPRIDPKTNPSWESVLKRFDEELAKDFMKRSPEWRADSQFFSDAANHLRAIKAAWRNPTMHVDKTYDASEANHVWITSRAFMQNLAKRLQE